MDGGFPENAALLAVVSEVAKGEPSTSNVTLCPFGIEGVIVAVTVIVWP